MVIFAAIQADTSIRVMQAGLLQEADAGNFGMSPKTHHVYRSTSSGLAVSIRTTSQNDTKSGTEVAGLLVTDALGYLEDR